MAEEGEKKPGYCRRHPIACGVPLLLVAILGFVVLVVALGVHPTLKNEFKKRVNEVSETHVSGEDGRGGGSESTKYLSRYCARCSCRVSSNSGLLRRIRIQW